MRLIDADKLIDEIDYYIEEAGWGDDANEVLGYCKEFIRNQTTAVKWIPVSEQMPEENEFVLVSFKFRIGYTGIDIARYENGWIDRQNNRAGEFCEILAWTPLPKAYKETADAK